MSAPLLSEAGPISEGASFYNPIGVICHSDETTPDTAEGVAPPLNNDTTPGLMGSVLPDSRFEVAADLDSAPASYIGEDGRLTQLREIDAIFRDMAAKSSGSGPTISQETLRLLPTISRTLIQFVSELQANNSQLHMSYARLQATQGSGQAREQHMEGKMTIHWPCVPGLTRSKAHIGVLQGKIESLKDAKVKLEFKLDDLRQDKGNVEQSYKNIKAQKDSLKAQLEQLEVGAVLDSAVEGSSKKRHRRE